MLVDEAHRTQYKDLAENMRTALPNANFIAFTGTPLLGPKRLTNQWFGDYVSEYNFAQSVIDKSTVPLFYSRRVPEVGLKNNWLDDDVVDIIEDENLNEEEAAVLENSGSKIFEVLKRDDRLDIIAKDIAYHFPRRGFLGKGMVVSVDKFTAVKMYDKVQFHWQEQMKNLTKERNEAKTEKERIKITHILRYMESVEMAVIVSEEADEENKFKSKGLDITKHRAKMNEIVDGFDIEDRFKNPNDKLRLVFVCAMWLTGFDVECLSTLYLDKPMKNHTLMQAIARANRVFDKPPLGKKPCGIVIDYVNVFKYMKEALSQYATNDENEFPAKDISKLIDNIDNTIVECCDFLKSIGIDIKDIAEDSEVLGKLNNLAKAYNIIVEKEENKNSFKVITNTLLNLYEASKPEIIEMGWSNGKFAAIKYLHGLMYNLIDDEKITRAKNRLGRLLDNSVEADQSFGAREEQAEYVIKGSKVIDLSKIDVEALRKEIKTSPYKSVEIDDLKNYLDKTLEDMVNKNCERIRFSERYKNIIDRYNVGGTENEEYYEQLMELMEQLKLENNRANECDMTEEELEIYDLLMKGKKLTKADEQKVKLAAKNLYNKLIQERANLLIVDWYKDGQPKAKVRNAIEDSLDASLPEVYDRQSFEVKTDLLLNHFIDMAVQGYGWIGGRVA